LESEKQNSTGLKKNCNLCHDERKALIIPEHPQISLLRQSELLDISRSSLYYSPKDNPEDKRIMDMIDLIYTDYPFYGSRRVKNELADRNQICICREHVQRLMRLMGIEAIYPKKARNTSVSDDSHRKYPYLLRNIIASHPNHIWGTDITYVRLEAGWAYLDAIIDWYSRYVVSWKLSSSMDTSLCTDTLKAGLLTAKPDIHNSDQGSQLTSIDYISILEENEINISMDGRGRCMDNIFTERLWRTVKYEDVYIKSYRNIKEAREGLNSYFKFYNEKRRHQSLDYRTPAEVYLGKKK
jgi:putative transposase